MIKLAIGHILYELYISFSILLTALLKDSKTFHVSRNLKIKSNENYIVKFPKVTWINHYNNYLLNLVAFLNIPGNILGNKVFENHGKVFPYQLCKKGATMKNPIKGIFVKRSKFNFLFSCMYF